MKKLPLMIATLLLCGTSAMAQAPAKGPSSEVLQTCLLGMQTHDWNPLKLTGDQLVRVERVQVACKTECEAAGVRKGSDPLTNVDGRFVIAELKSILTPEQYDAWVKHCSGSGSATAPIESPVPRP